MPAALEVPEHPVGDLAVTIETRADLSSAISEKE